MGTDPKTSTFYSGVSAGPCLSASRRDLRGPLRGRPRSLSINFFLGAFAA